MTMRRPVLALLLALAGCAHDGSGPSSTDLAIVVGEVLGGAAGALAAQVITPPAPVVVQLQLEPDGGRAPAWPDAGAGAPCSAVADRVCCRPDALDELVRRSGGAATLDGGR